jgi:hypothetical protein
LPLQKRLEIRAGKDAAGLLAAGALDPGGQAAGVNMALDGFPVHREQPRQLWNVDGHEAGEMGLQGGGKAGGS